MFKDNNENKSVNNNTRAMDSASKDDNKNAKVDKGNFTDDHKTKKIDRSKSTTTIEGIELNKASSENDKKGVFSKIKNSEIYQKIRGVKNIEIIFSLIIIAVALLIYSNIAFKSGDKDSSSGGFNAGTSEVKTPVTTEAKLSEILSRISGAGKVDVMIYSETVEKGDKSKLTEQITGVIIVAEGADVIRVRMELMQATMTLLNINSDKIEIFKSDLKKA